MSLRGWRYFLGITTIAFFIAKPAFAVDHFVSQADRSINVHRIAVLLVSDNVNGIFSHGVESQINDLLIHGHRFDLVTVKDTDVGPLFQNDATRQAWLKKLGRKTDVDGFLTCRIFRSQTETSVLTELYSGIDGTLLTKDEAKASHFALSGDVEKLALASLKKTLGQLPYKGFVLSRDGQRVTIDLGSSDGLTAGTIVNVEEIVTLKRDSQSGAIQSAEKEVLGKIKIVKADETLSFGVILQEKARGAVQKDGKVGGIDYVTYSDPSQPQPKDLKGSGVSFSNTNEVLPEKTPSFGRVGLGLGLGSFHTAASYQTAGSFSGDSNFYPQLRLAGEIWLTPNWFVGSELRQGVLPPLNPGANSVNTNTTYYDLSGGYRFLLQDDFWGPQLFFHAGISSYTLSITNQSPFPFSSTTYRGFFVGAGGSVPLSESKNLYADAQFNKYISPTLSESPVSSGATSDSSITTFSLGASYKLTSSFWLTAHLLYNFYSTTFSGQGTGLDYGLNSSQTDSTVLTGLDYYF